MSSAIQKPNISPISTINSVGGGVKPMPSGDLSFKGLLEGRLQPQGPGVKEVNLEGLKGKTEGVKFSQHALDRMKSRGIFLDSEGLAKINQAIEKATQKGAKDTLVLMGDAAMVVNIKNKTVVTAMDTTMMKENVFTNIDSTVII